MVSKEKSAGGIVLRKGKILMVKVKNLEGKIRWTFPKGHIEKGETAKETALREVCEETGWKCKAQERPFHKVFYQFRRDEKLVDKTVVWFLMRPVKKVQEKDAEEILKVRWFSLVRAKKIALYPSDKKLLKKIEKIGEKVNPQIY